MLARFLTLESLLLLIFALSLIVGCGLWLGLGWPWLLGLSLSFGLFAWFPLAARLQDFMIEQYLARGRYPRALKLASAIREGAHNQISRSLADFDLGLVHLARGAPADALRCFRRVSKHRLQERSRSLVELYEALAQLRLFDAQSALETGETRQQDSAGNTLETSSNASAHQKYPSERDALAQKVLKASTAASAILGENPNLLAAEAEARLAMGEPEAASSILARSLDIDPNPRDPSPGERYVLSARAAQMLGMDEEARRHLRTAASQKAPGPFVREAKALLGEMEGKSDRKTQETAPLSGKPTSTRSEAQRNSQDAGNEQKHGLQSSEGKLSEGEQSEGNRSEGDRSKGNLSEGNRSKGNLSEGNFSGGNSSGGNSSGGYS